MQEKFQAEQDKKGSGSGSGSYLEKGPFSWSNRGVESKNRNFDKNEMLFQLSGKRVENPGRSRIHVPKKYLPLGFIRAVQGLVKVSADNLKICRSKVLNS